MTEPLDATGNARVDDALGALTRLPDLPVSGHVAVFEEVFTELEGALASADDSVARPAGHEG
ncbi:hypothetical protein SAMN05421505_10712 [Sinosporangium album]|uniref:Uncharacterized protein n=1 Tax=Sinosporangium album TaxID=504805 RepID=A0A1G7WGP4_9ACTN|nr:hypothetical protein [Sinosporangium album]SDG70909.1 hypothetical protein SAMN05421505_10712 [Sinosporangium album]